MLEGFKRFILRGNVVDMAVGVVIGAAFGGVVTSLTKGVLTPFIGALVKLPDFSNLKYKVRGSDFLIGDFLNALISFLLIAAAVYFFVVARELVAGTDGPTAAGAGADHQEMSGVFERDPDRGEAVRALHAGGDGECGVERSLA